MLKYAYFLLFSRIHMLHNIRIVLVETSHAGNMGSTARAMKTMGLSNLYLVNPLIKPDAQAIALAAGARDVIENAILVDHMDDAIKDCSLVVGTSARLRTLSWPTLQPRECGVQALQASQHTPVALVFGRERVGLTNEELQRCNYQAIIPTNPYYRSLNLAMAVQILTYELRVAYLNHQYTKDMPQEKLSYPLADDLERFYQHLEQTLQCTGFVRQAQKGQVMNRLRRLFTRARPEERELSILRGMLKSIEKQNRNFIK